MEKQDIIYEKIITAKMIAGDKSAFSFLFTFYYANLVSFASTFTRDRDTSEEIVQDLFVHLWENRKTLLITTSLKSYLLKTVQNRCINWLKHLKIRDRHNQFVIDNSSVMEHNTENYILRSELEYQLEEALMTLPYEIAEAFRMNRYHGKKYQEIADIQNVSVRTIEDRMGKALNLLRVYLKEYLVILFSIISLTNKFLK